jgi:hypothetical protein
MIFHKDDGSDEPCRHMEVHLNHVADGTAGALRLWYTLSHVARCPRCRRFLESLKMMIGRLHKVRESEPSEDTVRRIFANYKAQTATAPSD